MTGSRRAVLQTLAEQAASKIGFTLRRWWQDATNPSVLRVEVERRMIGAPPAIGELTVPVPDKAPQRQKKSPSASARPRKLRRRQSTTAAATPKQTARPQKRKASTTATKELPRTQRKAVKTQERSRQRPSARVATGTRRTSSRKRRK